MRDKLAPLRGRECLYHAKVEKFGQKPNGFTTVMLTDLREAGSEEILAEHVWVQKPEQLPYKKLPPGTPVVFAATAYRYLHCDGEADYSLERIFGVKVEGKA